VGASTIAWELEKLGIENRPGLRTIEHILVRHQVPRRSRRGGYVPKGTRYPIGPSEVPNACQQGDLVGPRYVEDKSVFYAVNVIDVARRKPAGVITLARSADAIAEALVVIWNRLGVPARLQLDNQQALSGARGRPGKVARLCLTHGVIPTFIPFAEPWRNGVVERFNDTFDKKFYRTERFATIDHVTDRYQQFLDFHNATHRYSALAGATPDQAETRAGFTPRPPDPTIKVPDNFHDLTGHIEWVRLIRSDQRLHILNRTYPMPHHLRYEYVTATLTVEDRQLLVTHHGNEISRHPFPLT
jgi:transposase InsO family protein